MRRDTDAERRIILSRRKQSETLLVWQAGLCSSWSDGPVVNELVGHLIGRPVSQSVSQYNSPICRLCGSGRCHGNRKFHAFHPNWNFLKLSLDYVLYV